MADPTLEDVIEAITKLEAATKAEFVEVRCEMGANHAETTARLKRVEKQLSPANYSNP